MGSKIVKILLVSFLLLFSYFPVIASEVTDLVRVGITDNQFQNVLRNEAKLYATSDCSICDKQTHRLLMSIPADVDISIKNTLAGLEVTVGSQTGILRDFVVVSPSGLIGIRNLARKGMPALYHGAFEVVQKADRLGFYLVNIV